VNGVLEELREIARGIHPAVLTEGGLRPALRALARRSAVPVELDMQVAGRLPEPAEIAVLRGLQVGVRDDGRGGANFSRGSGLLGLKDRVEALGGRISLQSPAGAGTALQIALPLDHPADAGRPAVGPPAER
jgi:signal transduction histidine kinase